MKPEELLLKYKETADKLREKKIAIAFQLEEIAGIEGGLEAIKTQLRELVPQDSPIEAHGFRAYYQARNSVSYNPIQFAEAFPKLVEFVSETIINKDKIKGLIKGKILTEEQLEVCADKKTTFAFYLDMVDYGPETPEQLGHDPEAQNIGDLPF